MKFNDVNNSTSSLEPEIRKRKSHKNCKQGGYSRLDSDYYRYYKIWNNMMCRCYNPDVTQYKFYGGKGIKVCPEWLDFKEFFNWLQDNDYIADDDLAIDRIDENKGYYPENCVIVNKSINSAFTGKAVHFSVNGEVLALYELVSYYPEFRDDIKEYAELGAYELIPEMLVELGCEDDVDLITKEQFYKRIGVL